MPGVRLSLSPGSFHSLWVDPVPCTTACWWWYSCACLSILFPLHQFQVYTAGEDRGSPGSLNEIVPMPSWGCGYSPSTERSPLCPGLGILPPPPIGGRKAYHSGGQPAFEWPNRVSQGSVTLIQKLPLRTAGS